MPTSWRLPFSLLGLPAGAPPPPRVAVRIAPFDVVTSLGGGFVYTDATFEEGEDPGEVDAVPGGLYGEETFGPIPRTPGGGADLAAYAIDPFSRRPQIRRAGEVVLPARVLHPWLRRYALDVVQAATGEDAATVEGLLDGRLALDGDENVVPVARRKDDPAGDYTLGAAALSLLARKAGTPFDGVLHRIPVLPAGLRPPSRKGSTIHYRTPTLLYQRLLMLKGDLDDLFDDDGDGALGDHARANAALQRQVEGLFTDGLTAAGLPVGTGKAALPALAQGIGGPFGTQCLADLAAVDGQDAFILALRGKVFLWRAYVEASCLEILPLLADGSIDEATRDKTWTDRAAGAFHQVYEEQLGDTVGGQVMHGATPGRPHVDAYAFPPREEGGPAVVLTAGMSSAPMVAAVKGKLPHADPYVELVMLLPPDLDTPQREGMMRALLMLARFPFAHETFLARGHDVRAGGPVIPGSSLTAWVLYETGEDEDWTTRLSDALPRHPRYLHAVAVTEDERAFKAEHGSRALRERLERAGGLVSDPRRA